MNNTINRKLSLALLVPLLAGLFLAAAPARSAKAAEPSIELSVNEGPTGSLLVVRGKNQTGFSGHLLLTNRYRDYYLAFGEATIQADGTFVWVGLLPRAGVGFTKQRNSINIEVGTGEVTILYGYYGNFFGGEATFNVTEAKYGPFANRLDRFTSAQYDLWVKSDYLVQTGQVKRSWLWGPSQYITLLEPYAESPDGWRAVSYYDKTRMEITDMDAPRDNNPYYITNGLLVREMVNGQLQVGDNDFINRGAARVPAAGDLSEDNRTPLFSQYSPLQNRNPYAPGATINERLFRTGEVEADASLNGYNVKAAYRAPETNHYVASPFWNYLNSTGPLLDDNGNLYQGRIFNPQFYATGLPITEAYWTNTLVGGENKLVLVQLFERRVLTYTPSNPAGFQVEMGNVGAQYFAWRYGVE